MQSGLTWRHQRYFRSQRAFIRPQENWHLGIIAFCCASGTQHFPNASLLSITENTYVERNSSTVTDQIPARELGAVSGGWPFGSERSARAVLGALERGRRSKAEPRVGAFWGCVNTVLICVKHERRNSTAGTEASFESPLFRRRFDQRNMIFWS